MTAIFEFLFKYRPLLYEKGTLVFRPFWPWYVTLLLAAGIFLACYWIYHRTGGALPAGWRYSLAGLRALSLLSLLLIFLQPMLILHSVIPQKSFVAVAYDLSKSMEIRDGAGGESRLEIMRDLLRPEGNPLLEALKDKFKLRYFRFSNGAQRAGGVEDLLRHGNVTDIERSLNQVVAELENAPVAGIVLVTDGADNQSGDLAAAAARLRARNIPVYPVGIGSPEFARDTEILRVSAPRKALKDTMIEADVSVRASGYAGRRTSLLVKDGDRVLKSQEIMLGSDGEVKNFKIQFTSESAGARIFSIRVEPFKDELVPENNDQGILVRLEDNQPQILYVEGEPRWIYGFLRRAIQEDKNLHLVTLLRQADGKYLRQGVDSPEMLEQGFPVEKAELFRYKALIMGSIEASFFTFDQLRMISDFVGQRGGGFLMLGGKSSFGQGGYVNTPLEDLLPLDLRAGATQPAPGEIDTQEFKARLTGYGLEHPVTRVSIDEEESRRRWEAAPMLVGFNRTGGAKPGATVLAQAVLPDGSGPGPALLAFQRFGRGKSMALTTSSTWRWRMEQDHRDNFHELFWKQLLRWLVSDVPDPLNLDSEKHSYSLDESVALRAEVFDPAFLRVNNAQVTAQVKAPSGRATSLPLAWDVSREGQYTASFKPQEEGIYEVSAEARQGDRSLSAAQTNFLIAESLDEYHGAAQNSPLLKQLAADTGGRYYTPGDARTLAEDISYIDVGAARVDEKDLWDMPFLFLLLVAAVAAEWALRKRKGLA